MVRGEGSGWGGGGEGGKIYAEVDLPVCSLEKNFDTMTVAMPPKPSGQIGSTQISSTLSGRPAAQLDTLILPPDKEGLEKFFAARFATAFNIRLPLGPDVSLKVARQNSVDDIDFSIDCAKAKYLELGELNPFETDFGRCAKSNGTVDVYAYSKWVWQEIINAKATKYGNSLSEKTILLLYSTHWQFQPHEQLRKCLASTLQKHGCRFAAVMILYATGEDCNELLTVAPVEVRMPPPRTYKGNSYTNIPPDQASIPVGNGVEAGVLRAQADEIEHCLTIAGAQVLYFGPNH